MLTVEADEIDFYANRTAKCFLVQTENKLDCELETDQNDLPALNTRKTQTLTDSFLMTDQGHDSLEPGNRNSSKIEPSVCG